MAALASSAVSLYPTGNASEFFPFGKGDRDVIGRRLKLVLTGQGDAIDQITASSLGFTKLFWCSQAFDDDGDILVDAVVNPILNIIMLSIAADGATAVYTGSIYLTVIGTAKLSPAV